MDYSRIERIIYKKNWQETLPFFLKSTGDIHPLHVPRPSHYKQPVMQREKVSLYTGYAGLHVTARIAVNFGNAHGKS